jgi:hypothetical protein
MATELLEEQWLLLLLMVMLIGLGGVGERWRGLGREARVRELIRAGRKQSSIDPSSSSRSYNRSPSEPMHRFPSCAASTIAPDSLNENMIGRLPRRVRVEARLQGVGHRGEVGRIRRGIAEGRGVRREHESRLVSRPVPGGERSGKKEFAVPYCRWPLFPPRPSELPLRLLTPSGSRTDGKADCFVRRICPARESAERLDRREKESAVG